MKSGASVVSFNTAKSSISKFSRRSAATTAQDALITSQATTQAVQAAKAILKAGGSELTALKTAKAAAVSAMMPDPNAESEISSGIGTSFLRRRRLKRRAEVVASMALASAMVNVSQSSGQSISDWDATTDSLQGMKLVGGPTSSETLGMSLKESSSLSDDLGTRNASSFQSTAERIAKQLKMLPSLSATFSGSGGSGRFGGSADSRDSGRSAGSKGSNSSSSGSNSLTRQISSFTQNTKGQSTYSTHPSNSFLNKRRQGHHHDRCTVFPNNSSCLGQSYSEDNSDETELMSTNGTVDSMLVSILNVLSCGPSSASTRPKEVRVPNRMDDVTEEGEYDEEVITFADDNDLNFQLSGQCERIDEQGEDEDDDDGEDDDYGETDENKEEKRDEEMPTWKRIESNPVDDEAPLMNTSASSGGDSIGTTGEEILLDLLASAQSNPQRLSNDSTKKPPAVIASGNKFELRVPTASDSVDELTMDGLTVEGESEGHDENANYVQLVPPQRRNRRLKRGYIRVGGLTPVAQGVGIVPGTTGAASNGSPNKSRLTFFRKNKQRNR